MFASDSQGIAALLSAVDGIGQVYIGDRHIRDAARFRVLFGVQSGDSSTDIRGAIITREAIDEAWHTNTQTLSRNRWLIKLMRAKHGSRSESEFWTTVLAVHSKFRSPQAVGDGESLSAASTPAIEYLMIANTLCLYAEVELTTVELHTTTTPGLGQPTHDASTAGTVDGYDNVAQQLAAYVATVADYGTAYTSRVHVTSQREAIDMLTVPDADGDGLDLRMWQVWCDGETESQGLGTRVTTNHDWRLENNWGWVDDAGTYAGHQTHLDSMRAVFRGVGELGHTVNPTLACSSPLQVVEIGARMRAGILAIMPIAGLQSRELSMPEITYTKDANGRQAGDVETVNDKQYQQLLNAKVIATDDTTTAKPKRKARARKGDE